MTPLFSIVMPTLMTSCEKSIASTPMASIRPKASFVAVAISAPKRKMTA